MNTKNLYAGVVSESLHIGLCPCQYGWDEILAVLPQDFVPNNDLSRWVHLRHENRLWGFDIDSRDGNSPGRTLRAAGVAPDTVVDLLTRLSDAAWENEYRIMVAQYGFAPNLGGRMDAPTLGKDAMQQRIEKAIARGDLPTLSQWMAEKPSDFLKKLVGN